MTQSITVTDNRTGESREIPIVDGGVAASEWSKLLPGIWFYDPGFMTTALTESSITYIDGDAGSCAIAAIRSSNSPRNPRYIEVAYLLLHGELPNAEQAAAWEKEITYHTFIHENVRKRFLEGFNYDAHPMGMLVSAIAAFRRTTRKPRIIDDPEVLNKQIVRLIAKMPTLAAPPTVSASAALRLSRQLARPTPELPLDDVEGAEPRYEPDPFSPRARRLVYPARGPRAELRHDGHARAGPRTPTRTLRPQRRPPRCMVRCHGGANEAVLKMLTKIGSMENVPAFVEMSSPEKAARGFGHRVYKTSTRGRRS